jgi:hypothetical protein
LRVAKAITFLIDPRAVVSRAGEKAAALEVGSAQNDKECDVRRIRRTLRFILMLLIMISGRACAGEAAGEKELFEPFADVRMRYEHRSNQDFKDNYDDVSQFVAQKWTAGAKIKDGGVTARFAVRFARDRIADLNFAYLLEGYVELGQDLKFRVGRQAFQYGDSRILSDPPWSNVGRPFDGVKATWTAKNIQSDFIAAELVTPNGPPSPRPMQLIGNYNSFRLSKTAVLDLYILDKLQRSGGFGGSDYNVTAFGARLKGTFRNFGYYAEVIPQSGANGTKSHSALGCFGRLSLEARHPWRPKLTLGYDSASGTADPRGNVSGTYDPFFYSTHKYYGYMDLIGMRNMKDSIISIEARPRAGLTVMLDYHTFELDKTRDAWYGTTGAVFLQDPTGLWGPVIGRELDATFSWVDRTGTRTVDFGYCRFTPDPSVARLSRQQGRSDPSDFFFFSMEQKF